MGRATADPEDARSATAARGLAVLAVVLVIVLVITAGCSTTRPPGSPSADPGEPFSSSPSAVSAAATTSSSDGSADDVALARTMAAHADEGVAISELLLSKTDLDPDVQALAVVLAISQRTAAADLRGWLRGPARRLPSASPSPTSGTSTSSGPQDSDTLQTQMRALRRADGPLAEWLYLQLMLRHHEQAGAAAAEVLTRGRDTALVDLVRRSAEIEATQLKALQQPEAKFPPPVPGLTPPSGLVEPR